MYHFMFGMMQEIGKYPDTKNTANSAAFFISGWNGERGGGKSKHEKHSQFGCVFCVWNDGGNRGAPRHEKRGRIGRIFRVWVEG